MKEKTPSFVFLAKERYNEIYMKQTQAVYHGRNVQVPLFVEKDEDGFYVIECPLFQGCYTQGKTLDEALKNIRDVIALIAEEEDVRETLQSYRPKEVSLHTITL